MLPPGHAKRRACDERAIIGSRRLNNFFILTEKWGFQQPARLSPPAATNVGQMVKRQSYGGVCQS